MEIGKLNRRVVILERAEGRDAAGQPVTAWLQFTRLWANVRNTNGSEAIRADTESSAVMASIRVRYRTDITPAMRAQDGTTVYNIHAVLPDRVRKEHTDLVCEAIQ